MKLLSKESILSADDLPRREVEVPEWGGSIFVRTMTGADRDEFEASLFSDDDKRTFENMRARLASLTMVDKDGTRLFGADDIKSLGRKSSTALDRVFTAAKELNSMAEGDIEDFEKN